jgi:hypothetical protein
MNWYDDLSAEIDKQTQEKERADRIKLRKDYASASQGLVGLLDAEMVETDPPKLSSRSGIMMLTGSIRT